MTCSQLHNEEIKKLKASSIQEVLKSSELTGLVLKNYCSIFGCKNPKFCTKAITEYYIKLTTEEIMKKSQKYRLKDGVSIFDYASKTEYNNENLTDEIAKALIKITPKLIDNFEVVEEIKSVKSKK